ncbi:MAG: NUDIX domain-containing protein [Clostridia bacterium]|nr:NUDIX domain-containing protein [Clostridia bacterium]
METIKAGCILINKESKKVAIIYRERQRDFSFPKGHLEPNETIKECAIRETAEETRRVAKILDEYQPFEERYTTPSGEKCICYTYIAFDMGPSDNQSTDTHDTYWIPVEEVETKLTYENIKSTWRKVYERLGEILSRC